MSKLRDRIANLSPEKRALRERMVVDGKRTSKDSQQPVQTIVAVPRGAPHPLSFSQERIWFLNQIAAEDVPYNTLFPLRMNGVLKRRALERALQELIARHEVLRTHFETANGAPVQVIDEPEPLPLTVTVVAGDDAQARELAVHRVLHDEVRVPFDLSRGSLLRCHLLQLGPERHVLALVMHHIIIDEWSADVLFRELALLYKAFAHDQQSPLPDLPIQYADYAVWQRQTMQGRFLQQQLAYWREQLQGMEPFRLPTDRPRPSVQTASGARLSRKLSITLRKRTEALARAEGVTWFMLLLAAFIVLLHRWSGQEEIVIGSPTASRHRPEIAGLIGFFVNSLVLRSDVSGDPTFKEL
ncbi:MAG: non-ribosomal peptide synthetase, partial [Gammaproteobacteria bacterium]|nr:non-ribosomal peptide synthetase [Gammaproteobacteria bacterium]